MKKNRAKPPAMLLLEFVTDQRSNIYAEICAASTDANHLQSDEAGALLRSEIESVLSNLLSGRNLDRVTENLSRYATLKPPEIRLRAVGTSKPAHASDLFSTTKSIRLGSNKVFVDTSYDPSATAHQLIYGVLKRAIETNDIERLVICRRTACQKLTYRKSLKRDFCPGCRWKHRYEEAQKAAVDQAQNKLTREQEELASRFERFLRKAAGSKSGSKEEAEVFPIVKTLGGWPIVLPLYKKLTAGEAPLRIWNTLDKRAKDMLQARLVN